MNEKELLALIDQASERGSVPSNRITAIGRLAMVEDDRAFAALVGISTEQDSAVTVQRAAGKALGQQMIRRGWLGSKEYEVLPHFYWTGEADEAYDQTVAEYLLSCDK